jgi:hypothetical protein
VKSRKVALWTQCRHTPLSSKPNGGKGVNQRATLT